MRRFSLYRRGKIWYCQFYNPKTKRYGTGKSTGETNRDAAVLTVGDWLRDGIPGADDRKRPVETVLSLDTILTTIRTSDLTEEDGKKILHALYETGILGSGETPTFRDYLTDFWDYDKSPYVEKKLDHGQKITKRHCYDMAGHINRYWLKYFTSTTKLLTEITYSDLSAFSSWMAKKKLTPKSIKNVMNAGTVALRFAYAEKMIPADPTEGLMGFTGEQRERGILTTEEAEKAFQVPWTEERAKIGNLLAMTTGKRAGEVVALQVQDIGEDRLTIRHSYNPKDGLKSTKTNRERYVPLLPGVRDKLLEIAGQNPWGVHPASFVFWSSRTPDKPMDFHFLNDGLGDALLRLSLSEEELNDEEKVKAARRYWREERRIVFHSWRHYFSTYLADRVEEKHAMKATGHSTRAMFQRYADHANEEALKSVSQAVTEMFDWLGVKK